MTSARITERCRSLLIDDLHTDRIPHGGRSLFDHLAGTFSLLREWGNPDHVCLAGLFHSIYGTVRFRTGALPFSQRRQVRSLIGIDAETLAYLFCVTDRPKYMIAQLGKTDIIVPDRYLLDFVVLSRQELLWLLEIEAANLIEQREGPETGLQQLERIPLSPAARKAVAQYLSAAGRHRAGEASPQHVHA